MWLDMQGVATSESQLAAEFHANWRKPSGSLENWDRRLKHAAKELSLAIGAQHVNP